MKFKNKRKSFFTYYLFLGLLIPLSLSSVAIINKNAKINQKQDTKRELVSTKNQNYTTLNPEIERNGIKASFNLKNYTAKDFYEYKIPNLMDILKHWIRENIQSIVINYHELVYTSDILSVDVAPTTLDTSLHVTLELDRVITATGLTIGRFSFDITELATPQVITKIKANISLLDILPIQDIYQKTYTIDNISSIVSNYPDIFLSEISQSVQNMKLELKGQKISVILPNLTISENGVLEPNREITFEIGGFSSNDKNTTLNLDIINANNSEQFNNIFKDISAFKIDWDNYIFTTSSSYNETQNFVAVENVLLEYLNSSNGLNLFSNIPNSIDAPVSGVKISKNQDNYKVNIYYIGYKDGLIVNNLVKEIPIYLKSIPSSTTIFLTSNKFELGFKNYLLQKPKWPTTKNQLIDYLREYTLTWVLNVTANRPGLDIPIVYLDFNLIVNNNLINLDTNGEIKISSRALSIAPNTTKYPFINLLDEKYIIYQILSNSGMTITKTTTLATSKIKLNNYIQVLIYVSIAIFAIFIVSFLIILIMKYFERKKMIYPDSDIDIF